MRPLWQLCLSELLQEVIIYCIMPVARSPELFMFDSIVIMSSWIVQLAVLAALFLCSLPKRKVGHTCQHGQCLQCYTCCDTLALQPAGHGKHYECHVT